MKRLPYRIISLGLLLLIPACSLPAQEAPEAFSATQTQAPVSSEMSLSDCHQVAPSETNEAIENWDEPHFVCPPQESAPQRGKLFVFLPGTGARPADYTNLLLEAARAGFYSIGLRYPNDEGVNMTLCPQVSDPNCHENIRAEILYGSDMSELVSVDAANSILHRLQSALVYMRDHFPDEGWGQFLTADDEIGWSSLVVAGHSQGGGHAIFMAREYQLDHAIAFTWVDVRNRELAPWLTETEFRTPAEDIYLFWHQGDRVIARYQPALMTALGLDEFGVPVVVDGSSPPYQESHGLIATTPPPAGEIAHNTVAVDWALNFDRAGRPIYRDVWRYLLTLEAEDPSTGAATQAEITQVESFRLGDPESSYIDPEILDQENMIAFVDEHRAIWLATLDPETGLFVTPDGKEMLIDTDITPLLVSFSGPEFGVDQDGWSLYYTKDQNGVPQIWQANVDAEEVLVAPISGDSTPRSSVLASEDPTAEAVRLLYAWNGLSTQDGMIAWLDVRNLIDSETLVDRIDRGVRWIDGTTLFAFITFSGTEEGQIALYDTSSGELSNISNTTGQKSYSYGWIAPEYDDILILTIVDDSRLEIFHDEGGSEWERIATLEIPAESAYTVIGSPETFTADGSSYISLVVKQSGGYAPAEVWVWGFDHDQDGVRIRCEDGLGVAIRSDPESYIGENEVYIYYNVIRSTDGGGQSFELYRCETGITP